MPGYLSENNGDEDRRAVCLQVRNMSRAFVKEAEGEWLGDVAPDVPALEQFLTREYGEKIYLLRTTRDPATNRDILEMTSGSRYALDFDGRWERVE